MDNWSIIDGFGLPDSSSIHSLKTQTETPPSDQQPQASSEAQPALPGLSGQNVSHHRLVVHKVKPLSLQQNGWEMGLAGLVRSPEAVPSGVSVLCVPHWDLPIKLFLPWQSLHPKNNKMNVSESRSQFVSVEFSGSYIRIEIVPVLFEHMQSFDGAEVRTARCNWPFTRRNRIKAKLVIARRQQNPSKSRPPLAPACNTRLCWLKAAMRTPEKCEDA